MSETPPEEVPESVRQVLADAVTAVDGLVCTPFFAGQIGAGTAFVKDGGIRYPNKFGGVQTWSVVIGLPQDLATAEAYMARKVPAVVRALLPHMQVTESTGVQQLDIPGIGINLTATVTGLRETEE